MSIHANALDYYDHGYWVIPTIRGQKKAAVKWREFQTVKPTLAQVNGWFSVERNIGVICGAGSNTVVVDADDEDAERWVRTNCLPTPFRVRTRKGCHYYYRHPGVAVASKPRVIPGINVDVRGDGGLATGIGSVHETGFVYTVDRDSDMVAPSELPMFDPSWFPKPRMPRTDTRGQFYGLGGFDRAERYIRAIPGAGEGMRNQTAYHVAASVVRDFALDFEQGMSLLTEWNKLNDPPLPESELACVVRSCLTSGRQPVGVKLNA